MKENSSVTARVLVYPQPEIPDPEGKAIADALRRIGFDQVSEVHAGRSFEIVLAGVEEDRAREIAEQMAVRLLAQTGVEGYAIEILAAEPSQGASS